MNSQQKLKSRKQESFPLRSRCRNRQSRQTRCLNRWIISDEQVWTLAGDLSRWRSSRVEQAERCLTRTHTEEPVPNSIIDMFIGLLKHWSQLYWAVGEKQSNNAMHGSLSHRVNLLLCLQMKSHKAKCLIPVVTREYPVYNKLRMFVPPAFYRKTRFLWETSYAA